MEPSSYSSTSLMVSLLRVFEQGSERVKTLVLNCGWLKISSFFCTSRVSTSVLAAFVSKIAIVCVAAVFEGCIIFIFAILAFVNELACIIIAVRHIDVKTFTAV